MKPTACPSGSMRSSATRSAAAMAAIRRGCVQTMFTLVASPLRTAFSRMYCGTCVVLPQPVEPEMSTTGLASTAARISSVIGAMGSLARCALVAAKLGSALRSSCCETSIRFALVSSPASRSSIGWSPPQGFCPHAGGLHVISLASGRVAQGAASKSSRRLPLLAGRGETPSPERYMLMCRPNSRSCPMASGGTAAWAGRRPSASTCALVLKGGISPILQSSTHIFRATMFVASDFLPGHVNSCRRTSPPRTRGSLTSNQAVTGPLPCLSVGISVGRPRFWQYWHSCERATWTL
mmetsp:Transcript_61753/g.194756  ORF Transcript_61753/g.194756 Transcript_61753/m.194756 type:complete len:294 (+) Transcript_61753:2066-2947(+)